MKNTHKEAEKYLSKKDATLKKIISKAGSCTLMKEESISPFQSLLSSIVFQQLHGKAAQTILNRFLKQFPRKKFPTPKDILSLPSEVFRSCGLSASKTIAIKDLALKASEGKVPTTKKIHKLSDEEIIEQLTQIKGIGVWTVQMMLMFKLGRFDVMPHGDFGVQKGFSIAYKKPHPKPKELLEFSERWKPYRSVAAWYMWRVVDLVNERS